MISLAPVAYADAVIGPVKTGARVATIVAAVVALAALVSASPADAAEHAPHWSHSAPGDSDGADFRFTLARDDGQAVVPNAPNFAARTITTSPLLLFLAATRAHPADYQSFLTIAKAGGYHVLALDYANTGLSVEKTCGQDPRCYTDLQRNRLTGLHPGRFSSVSPADSILSRFRAAIGHLEKTDPHGGWGRFVNRRGVDWRRVVVAGHSQGGGESAYIAHLHLVRGALFFSSPVDTTHGISASWMGSRNATPPSRMYGFVNRGDIFYHRIRGSWKELGMNRFGAPAIAGSARRFRSHEVLSTTDLGTPIDSHLRTITDKTPRTAAGRPVFGTVWEWMLKRLYTPPSSFTPPPVAHAHIVNS